MLRACTSTSWWLTLLLATWNTWDAGYARGDVIELKNGGRIQGEIVDPDEESGTAYTISTPGGGQVTVARSEVARVVSRSQADEEYERRARDASDNADAHWQLAQWCRNNLRDQYRAQLARVLELDPHHEPARRALGHQKKNNRWMSREEIMAARGMVWYDGKYRAQQHIELLQQAEQARNSEADWANRLKRWRRWLTGRRQDRAEEALREIRSIRDPLAASAVVDLLREEQDPAVRRLLIDVAAQIDDPQTVDALVTVSLFEPNDDELRYQCLEYLIQSGQPGIAGPYIRALKNPDNLIVNRAAEALETIGNRDAIGPLINALVTKHKFQTGGSSPDQHSYMFTPSGGTAMNFGGSGSKVVTQAVENRSVLTALVKLSGGASFSYEQQRWRDWLAAQARANPVDVRRDL